MALGVNSTQPIDDGSQDLANIPANSASADGTEINEGSSIHLDNSVIANPDQINEGDEVGVMIKGKVGVKDDSGVELTIESVEVGGGVSDKFNAGGGISEKANTPQTTATPFLVGLGGKR